MIELFVLPQQEGFLSMSDVRPLDRGAWTLVTGGAGFIGSHTVDRLLSTGHSVIVLDNFSTGSRDNLNKWAGCDRLRIIEADVVDGLFVPLHAFSGRMRSIIHLAAQTSVLESITNPLHDIRNNYIGTVNALDFARTYRIAKVVFSSSASVYSEKNNFPTCEFDATTPVSPYAINKLACEHIINVYCMNYGLNGSILRFFNVYGPRQRKENSYSGVISTFCGRALRGEPLIVHGDGSQTRDFVFVTDVASAICAACDHQAASGRVFNVGSGIETSILNLAEIILEIKRGRSELRFATARPGSVQRSCAAIDRAIHVLGYEPRIDLRTGVQATLEWSIAQPQAA